MIDPTVIPNLYTWIKNNLFSFISISICLLAIYGLYQFINGYAPNYGALIATQHEDLKRAVASYTALDSILEKNLIKFKASRVGLFRFHDSEKDVSRMAFFFVSVANLLAAPGINVDVPGVTNLPAATFAPVLQSLIAQKSTYILTRDLPAGALRELQLKRGTKGSLYTPIQDLQDNIIGFLCLEWVSEEDFPLPTELHSMITSLESDAIRISGFFSLSHLPDRK